jgi:hypothetical protein
MNERSTRLGCGAIFTQRHDETTMTTGTLKSMLFALALIAPSACADQAATAKKDPKAETKPAKTDKDAKVSAEKAKTTEAPATTASPALTQALDSYESIRAKLAADEGALKDAATKLAGAAKEAKQDALAAAADALATMPADDLGALRKQFGEVSKELVTIVAADPALQKGHFVFKCPMAKGYQKWVQREDKLANPYMGTKMLGCGSKSEWKS